MSRYVMLNGIRSELGDVLVATDRAYRKGYANKEGEEVNIYRIKEDRSGLLIGLVRQDSHDGWSDLDGQVKRGYGLWMYEKNLASYFIPAGGKSAVVKNEFFFRRTNLEGLHCKILASLPDGKSVFVEFKEDIGGCASDGLGKAGHCIAIPTNCIKVVTNSKK